MKSATTDGESPGMLLTIAIPTYNRGALLDLCLTEALPQVARFRDRVELLVSDNCSSDHTGEVVRRHQGSGVEFRYIRNEENLGADRNFAQCYAAAKGRYLLLLGDDDVLLDGALERLLPVLAEEDYGVVHVKSYSFRDDFRAERPKRPAPGTRIVFDDPRTFADKLNMMLTFISGNVVNRSVCGAGFDPSPFVETNLVQLSWTLEALLKAEKNVFLDDYLVAAKADNTGGYRLCNVFGVNMNRVFRIFIDLGADPALFDMLNRKALTSFLPNYIVTLRKTSTDFQDEDYHATLYPVFKEYTEFWTMVYPAIHFPVPVAKGWLKLCKKWFKLTRRS